METTPSWWRVKGADLIDGSGNPIRMRGVCLGAWMNMENWAIGYPGNEAGLRDAMAEVLGPSKAAYFFERFLDSFVTEADLRYITSLGLNVIRVALNYHHFESDAQPYEYHGAGLARLDQLIAWAGKHGLHVILDLHAAPGWQSPGWHCDNPGHRAHFWSQKSFEDRAVALWGVLAGHYRSEAAVAGYNLLNEPVASGAQLPALHRYYRRATQAIRAVDPDHVIFLDGNHYAQRCDELEPPFDDNTVYGYHFYPEPVLETRTYPALLEGQTYDSAWLERELLGRARFMCEHNVPAWAGEFGAFFAGDERDADSARAVADMIAIMEQAGHHWTLWHYKDIGPMGVVTLDPASEWMERTRPVRALKTAFRCDYWVERGASEVARLLNDLIVAVRRSTAGVPGRWETLPDEILGGVCQEGLSQLLLPAFAEQFRGMTEPDIERLMQSFAFERCVPRGALAEVVKAGNATVTQNAEGPDLVQDGQH